MKRSRSLPLLLVLVVLLIPAIAAAQAESFALNRYNPSERGSDWFANESLDLRGHLRPALGVVGDWSYKPLVLYDQDGNEIAAIVEHQVFAHIGGGLILWDRVRGALSLPLLVYNEGAEATTANATFSSEDATSIGDLRLGADVRLLGVYGGPFTLAAGTHVHLPTGNQDAYASDGNVRIQPHLLGAGEIDNFAYAGQLSLNYRAHSGQLDDAAFGSEVTFAAAAGLRFLRKKLLVGPELFGSTVVSEGGAAFARRTTPVEFIFGGKYQATDQVRVGAGFGPGLTRGFGAPLLRVLASVEWMPDVKKKEEPAAPGDRDDDGILDDDDACPDTPGEPNDDQRKHGCPPGDRDGDEILDEQDACPDTPGEPNDDQRKHGCPPGDRDGDGVLDDDDACPDEPGERSDDPEKNGCPPPTDRDGDGIYDDEDACVDTPGKPSKDPKKHGCPKVKVEETEIVIFERVEFETNKAILRPESDEILNELLEILKDHPKYTKISIEGHTDSRGADWHNQGLSERRAAAVARWLTAHGIAPQRLRSKGFGESKPIDTNETDEGRQNNRRVEFHIVEIDGKPVKRRRARKK